MGVCVCVCALVNGDRWPMTTGMKNVVFGQKWSNRSFSLGACYRPNNLTPCHHPSASPVRPSARTVYWLMKIDILSNRMKKISYLFVKSNTYPCKYALMKNCFKSTKMIDCSNHIWPKFSHTNSLRSSMFSFCCSYVC